MNSSSSFHLQLYAYKFKKASNLALTASSPIMCIIVKRSGVFVLWLIADLTAPATSDTMHLNACSPFLQPLLLIH